MCKWAQNPDEVEFVLGVLERLAKRYGHRKGLFGIQPLNEPVTENMWGTMDVQNRYAPADPELAKGSAPISMENFIWKHTIGSVLTCQRKNTLCSTTALS